MEDVPSVPFMCLVFARIPGELPQAIGVYYVVTSFALRPDILVTEIIAIPFFVCY